MVTRYPPVIVKWADHFFDDATASVRATTARAIRPYIIISAGFLLETSKKCKFHVLFQSINEDDELSERLFLIKQDIVEIIYLSEVQQD